MDDKALYSIGDLARRTGLTVKAIRFYADTEIVPPTDRSAAGYRLYGSDAVVRIELVRTVRELEIDLDTIRKIVAQEVSLADVAATHVEALGVQMHVLQQRRAVLTSAVNCGSTPQEMRLMHRLARLSAAEQQRLVDGFLDAVFERLQEL